MVWLLTSSTGYDPYDLMRCEARNKVPEVLRNHIGLQLVRVFELEEEASRFVIDNNLPMASTA